MPLVEEQSLSTYSRVKWNCSMHPEIIRNEAGSCPICGMELVPMQPNISAEEKTYKELLRKFWIALSFTLRIFLIAMSEMIPDNPLYKIIGQKYWNWVQFALSITVVIYAAWMFFQRAYKSIIT